MSLGCPALLALSPGALLTWILGSAHLLGTEPQDLHSAHLDPADCGICSPEHTQDLLTCLGLCPKTCILLTWTLQTVGSAHLDPADWDLLTWTLQIVGSAHLSTPWICSCCWICSPGSAHRITPWTCSPCGICVPGPAHLDLLTLWDLCPWTCSPGPCRLWDLCPWICSPEHSQDLLTWICSPCEICAPGPAQLVGSVHLDPTDCGICSPEHALDLLTWTCSPEHSQDLLTLWDLCLWICSPEHSQDLLTSWDLLTWTLQTVGSPHLSTPRTCSPCGTCAFRTCPPGCSQTPGSQGPKPPIQLLPPPSPFFS
ncbi:uncharacterized protein [Agelaius tricolor]|uniref:uncharacterized protein isoform X15 n=1 Tax=Agelaius tricolor TaxID=9191 RepID=UPI0039F20F51